MKKISMMEKMTGMERLNGPTRMRPRPHLMVMYLTKVPPISNS